jgi:hypothetical protein
MEGPYRPRVLRARTAVLMSRPPRWYSSTDASTSCWARDDLRGLREHGELYVFEFDGGHEIDWDLSSLLPSRRRHPLPGRSRYKAEDLTLIHN